MEDKLDSKIKILIWIGVVTLLTVCFAAVPLFTDNLSFMFYMMLWIIMASAFNFVAGLAGYMPFGYVAFYGVGAYATGILYKTFGLPIPVALIGAGLMGVAVGLLLAPTLRLRGVYFGIVSLALAMAAKLTIALMPAEITGGSLGLILSSANNPLAAYYAMFIVLLMLLACGTWLSMSRTGTALRAIRDDQEAAAVVGVNVVGTRMKAWISAALFPALVGGVEAWYTNAIDLESSFNLLITAKSIVYAMAGGLGYLVGPILGSGLLYGVDQLIWRQFPTLNLLLLGVIIVVLMLMLPRGIVGAFAQRFSKLRKYIP
ncbi:branched-chain amino acid ABC transporter permease [Roseovarius sp. SCSIO 43702]|uniref:branched-chain amino acid ABC transporter permease n=1 Tax=Roseovarius sp. SCSIO 43702 TaxID=2823043 RepID=UPI001C72DBF0|nr:branched-chain amino acid ABC transporter permease [Roseovarius sp. SCSIO 43702]QYX58309.1 branched-chain amino acid ABC transporter permease [Roseovarius sp. SCSIO 43702]